MKNYWGYRIDTREIDYFQEQLNAGVLRQGWGYNEGQNLKYDPLKFDKGANRNRRMLKVKKGDYLLIPQLPEWGKVTIAEATEDWEEGYRFEIDKEKEDYGHKFPAKIVKVFVRNNRNVDGNIRTTLKCKSRFWSINHYRDEIEELLNTKESLLGGQTYEDRFNGILDNTFKDNFDEDKFKDDVYEKLNKKFCNEEWEFALVEGLKSIFPFYEVIRIGGKEEKKHGTDILIKLPGITENADYGIAIQVKDHREKINNKVVDQIRKSTDYFEEKDGINLIDRIIIITQAKEEKNQDLINYANMEGEGVKIIFAEDLKDILLNIGKKVIGID